MHRIILYIFLLAGVFLSATGLSAQNKKSGSLKVVIENIKNNKGTIQVGLCDTKAKFNSKSQIYMDGAAPIKKKRTEITFENVAYGTYAIKIYHDKNGNNQLDRNTIGIPTEEYGFSNDAKGLFGPASWEDAKFEFKKDGQVIVINMN